MDGGPGRAAILAAAICCCVSILAGAEAPAVKSKGVVKKDLGISLSADRDTVSPGQEIRFTIVLTNKGGRAFRIFEATSFVGQTMAIECGSGQRIPLEGGYLTWSPKAGVFAGRTVLLKPGSSHTIRMDAYLDREYRLIFSNDFEKRDLDFKAVRKQKSLPADFPDKYIGDGRIYPLRAPGTCRLVFEYAKSDQDKAWRVRGRTPQESSTEDIWMGEVESKPLVLTVSAPKI